ncbi:hypothetical protein [Snuella sedimenti]|uniref:Uncharacterized protein n=1 Tax=Snuella sedimenti TaxID=2798802 RepID=A0A8J7LXS7_9FLAO|nr:hypothetical protein [Snuella sedimenti]MBJ6367256.1 hypothetical protein [Snuella sedimenti]
MTNHNVAQFLLINADVVKSMGIDSRLALTHYFFKYAEMYTKDLYNNFAFDFLEDILSELFSDEEEKKDAMELIKLGYALVDFSKKKFFESSDLEEILHHIDKVALKEGDIVLKSPTVEKSASRDLCLIAMYIAIRIAYFDKGDYFYQASKQLLLAVCSRLFDGEILFNNKEELLSVLEYAELLNTLDRLNIEVNSTLKKREALHPELSKQANQFFLKSITAKDFKNAVHFSLFVKDITELSKVNMDIYFDQIGGEIKDVINNMEDVNRNEITEIMAYVLLLANYVLYREDFMDLGKDIYLKVVTADII